jgi:hypothetical protein
VSNLPLQFARFSASVFKGSPAHVSSLAGPTTTGRYPASYATATDGGPIQLPWVSCRLSATGIGFLDILSRRGIPPLLRSAYQTKGPDPDGVSTFRTLDARPDWVPSLPRDHTVLIWPVVPA